MKSFMLLLILTLVSTAANAFDLVPGTLSECTIQFFIAGDLNTPVTSANKGQTVVVKVTAAHENWVVSTMSADGYTSFEEAKSRRTAPTPSIIKDIVTPWNTGDENNTYEFVMPEANVQVHVACVEASKGLEVVVESAEQLITEKYDEKIKNGTITPAEMDAFISLREAYRQARNVFDNPEATDAEKAAARLLFLKALRTEALL